MDFATAYLSQQKGALVKWKALEFADYPALKKKSPVESFTPYFGTSLYSKLSPSIRDQLYWGFIQLVCEAFIVFEQMLLCSVRRLCESEKVLPRRRALEAFAKEEFYHLRAYRKYLNENKIGSWPEALVSQKNPALKNFYAALLRFEPLCIFMPGAKSEIFSIQYLNFMHRQKEFVGTDWHELNRLHSIDEVHHCTFDFHLMNSYMEELSFVRKLKILITTYFMFLGIQFIVLISGVRLIRRVFSDKSAPQKLFLNILFFHWSVRRFEPYVQTKKQMKTYFRKNPFRSSFLFKYLTW